MNKKYIIKIYTLLLLLPLLFTSCDDFLDITPDGQVKRSDILSSPEGIEDALYGAYSQLRHNSLYGMELSFHSLEVMAHTMWCRGNTTLTNLGKYDYKYSYIKSTFEAVWTLMYKNISNVNSVLNCDLIVNATEFPYTLYKGEALGLRAFMHFDLVRLYAEQYTQNPEAKGIPYATEFSLNTPDFESLKDNYKHILEDLLEAEKLLDDESQHSTEEYSYLLYRQSHINKWAVKALLARVYLTMGDKENALIYAQDVIHNSPYKLKEATEVINDLAGVLSHKECIFGVYWANFYGNVSPKLQQMVSFYSLDPRKDIMEIYDKEVDGLDYRQTAYFTRVEQGGTDEIRLSKLTDIYQLQGITSSRPSHLILGINLIRIPEMYYICAECLLDKDYQQALQYFDEVLTHRGLTALENRTTGNVLTQELIDLDRYKEYIGEGQLFFNYKRQHLPISSADGSTVYEPSKEMYVVPIPDNEYSNRY